MSAPEPQKLGEFEILEKLGHGGMGAVYKARQISLGRFVALKVLPAHMASDEEFITRFKAEARSAASLNHPGIVQVYAAGEDHGTHYFAMEFVDGESLHTRLKRKGRIEPAEALAICAHVATSLNHAWQKARVIHRDIKPDNIFLSSDGDVKLGDLGLAKSVIGDSSLTRTGASMGTPYYISPEQAHGEANIDFRSDIYSLGCTLFHLLSGETPYTASNPMAVMIKHITQPPPDITKMWPECPAPIAPLLARMLAKDPSERPQSYEELVRDLMAAHARVRESSRSTEPARKLPTSSAPTPAKPEPRRPAKNQTRKPPPPKTAVLIGLGAFFLLIALLVWAPWRHGPPVPAHAAHTTPAPATPTPTPVASISSSAPTPSPFPVATPSSSSTRPVLVDANFTAIFNGRDLSDWEGDPKVWSVRDGEIQALGNASDSGNTSSFLTWKGSVADDFILQASVLVNAGSAGIQYRSRQVDSAIGALAGYQMMLSADRRELRGAIYEERGTRGVLAESYGEYVRWRSFGAKEILRRDGGIVGWKAGEWNKVRITARGTRLTQEINGVTTAEVVDEDPARQSLSGLIGLQVATSNTTTVRFRDLQIQRLSSSSSPRVSVPTPPPATPATPALSATPAPLAATMPGTFTSRLNPGGGITFEGTSGPGVGKHVVLLAGDEEYRSEELMPQLAKILALHHGFKCTVLFSIDPQTGTIDPNETRFMPGLEALATADLCIMGLRFRNWPDAHMKYFADYYLAGKPFVALRTSTHAFSGIPATSPYQSYNYNSRTWVGGFGQQVLGETWLGHWGTHKSQATRAILEPAAMANPILRGVTSFIGPTDVYEVSPPTDVKILLRGQVLNGMTEIGGAASGRKKRIDGLDQAINEPMMPIAWTREQRNPLGRYNRVFTCTMGTAAELQEESFRRLLVNASYWAMGLTDKISTASSVTIVGSYTVRDYGMNGFARGLKPADFLPPGTNVPTSPAPSTSTAAVGQKLTLFDGRDTSAWLRDDGRPCDWPIVNGALDVGSMSIVTKEKFRDFQMHAEFWIPRYPPSVTGQARGNSGIYLQRRYEIQILDSFGLAASNVDCGAIYKFRAPTTNASTAPETWQSYDIFFRAARFDSAGRKTANARVTVIHNGITIHSDVEIPASSGLGIPESNEPGPILLQSNVGKVRFRNLWAIPLSER